MDDIHKNIEEYNLNKKIKILIVTEVTELFIWGRMLNISLVFITQSCFAMPKKVIITIADKIRDEKLQYDLKRKAAKISAFL